MEKNKGLIAWMLVLCLVIGLNLPMALTAAAGENTTTPETVKVGFFAFDGYHEIDEDGCKSGYGYDFLELTQKYVNLNYEYVGYEKSWEETQQMLLDGEIDLATSAHKTEERLEKYDFSMPIGTNTININTRETETRFIAGDYTTYDGMTIGLIEGSTSNAKVESFAKENGFQFVAKYYSDTNALKNALESQEIDAVATSSLRKMNGEKVLSEFDTEYFYVIVRKGDTELLDKINYAITQLNSSEGNWKNDLYYDNYTSYNYDSISFTDEEKEFIKQYSTGGKAVVVAIDDDWLPYSYKEDDEYVGMLPEYIAYYFNLCGMNYTYYDGKGDFNNGADMETAGVDLCVGYNLDDETAQEAGLLISATLFETSTAYLRRKDSSKLERIAISKTTPYLNTRLNQEDYVSVIEYADTESAKQAVSDGTVDAAFLYSYDAEYTVNHDKAGKLAFTQIPNSQIQIKAVMPSNQDHTLMSILMKCINYMPDTEKSAIKSKFVSFAAEDLTIQDYIVMHPFVTTGVGVIVAIILFIAIIIFYRSRMERAHRAVLEGKLTEITQLNQELKENQEWLEEARSHAEAANSAKTTFLFNMSHDIRTPMNAIIGFTNLLEKHQEEPEKRGDYLKKIQDSSGVLLSILNNVLEMARIEKGVLKVDEVAWSAEQFNDTLYSVFHDLMKEKGIEFTRQVVVKHHYVFCDPIKLREVFLNILSNAYKYTSTGGKVNMHLEEIPSDRPGFAMYQTTISDTGIGMTPDYLPHIFEEFSRESNTTENKIEGTGLGMPIVKRLVDVMEGTICVTSEKGQGSEFTVTIPHRIAAREDLVNHPGVKVNPELFVGKRILLAEDNALNAEIAIEILKEAGFAVERAEDGQICLDMLKQADAGYYDLVLMDIQMPNMNGYESTKAIRALADARKAEIPILAMTANAFEEDKKEAFRCGMNGHLAKPVEVRELLKTLSGILN